jgi:hypothetical protein
MALTLKVDFVRQLGNPGDNDSFKVYMVVGQKKHHIRTMTIKQLRELRAANEVPDDVTDPDFLFGDASFNQFMSMIQEAEGVEPHLEFSLHTMSPKKVKKGQERVEFPANVFEPGGTKKSTSHPVNE